MFWVMSSDLWGYHGFIITQLLNWDSLSRYKVLSTISHGTTIKLF